MRIVKPPDLELLARIAQGRADGKTLRAIGEAEGLTVRQLDRLRKLPEYGRIKAEVDAQAEADVAERMRAAASLALATLVSIMRDPKASTTARASAATFVWKEAGIRVQREESAIEDMTEADVLELLSSMPRALLEAALSEAS